MNSQDIQKSLIDIAFSQVIIREMYIYIYIYIQASFVKDDGTLFFFVCFFKFYLF